MTQRRLSRAIRRMGRHNVLSMLQKANQLFTAGQYSEALQVFEQLARGAEERYSERAPFLYLEAGRAAIMAGQSKTGIGHLRRGLTLLGSQGRFPRMRILGRRILDELNARGLQIEANEIAELLNANLPRQDPTLDIPPIKNPILPTHCPNCGGALRPDEIEWLDEITAECEYCGSPVRGDV